MCVFKTRDPSTYRENNKGADRVRDQHLSFENRKDKKKNNECRSV